MRNLVKLVFGTALGAGIGAALSKAASRDADAAPLPLDAADAQPRETFKQRLERARAAGEIARVAKEEELRRLLRNKVNGSTAVMNPE